MTLLEIVRENREFVKTWVRFSVEADYIDTKLGILWIILQPIVMAIIYTFAFGTLIQRAPRGGVPFVIYFLAGTSVWQVINNNLMKAGHVIVRNITLLSQVNLSKVTLVIIQIVESLVEFSINLVILIIASAIMGYYPNSTYLYLPWVLFSIILFTLGGVLFISTIGVYIRDIPNVVSIILRILFFLSGVIISPDMIKGKAGDLLIFNPILTMIEATRDIVIYAQAPSIFSLVYMSIWAIMAYIIGYLVFQRYQGTFVDYR